MRIIGATINNQNVAAHVVGTDLGVVSRMEIGDAVQKKVPGAGLEPAQRITSEGF